MVEIRTEVKGCVGTIIIDNEARMNALNEAMWRALPETLREFEQDIAVRVIILRGSGTRAFSAGADISEFDTVRAGSAAEAYNQLNTDCFQALRACQKPTISLISGFCLGGGLLLALATDLRLAATSAQFSLPPAKLGIGFDARWLEPLLETVSPQFAKELLFTGQRISSERAQAVGLVNRVIANDELEEETFAMANEIAGNAPLTVNSLKQFVDALASAERPVNFESLDALTEQCMQSEDYQEGRQAFAEKRTPNFKGH